MNFQFHLVCALTDSELIKKLLTLDLKATTAKMLKTCRTHIAIADNLNAMGLRSKTAYAVNKWRQWPQSHPQQQQQKHQTPRTNMHVGIALSPMHLTEPPAMPRTPHTNHVAELATGTSDAKALLVNRMIQSRSHPDMGTRVENKSRPTLLM